MCVCMCGICEHVCAYVCMYECHACLCVHYVSVQVCICTCVCTYVWVCIHVNACGYLCVCKCVWVCIHVNAHVSRGSVHTSEDILLETEPLTEPGTRMAVSKPQSSSCLPLSMLNLNDNFNWVQLREAQQDNLSFLFSSQAKNDLLNVCYWQWLHTLPVIYDCSFSYLYLSNEMLNHQEVARKRLKFNI